MVGASINHLCQNVLDAHVDPLTNTNMSYVVYHANKRALFNLKSRLDTFDDIKSKIAAYFGLPNEKIFLKNSQGMLLLGKDRVVDELFPLQSSKIREEERKIYVTFQRDESTLEYILGNEKKRQMELKQEIEAKKEAAAAKEAEAKLNQQRDDE